MLNRFRSTLSVTLILLSIAGYALSQTDAAKLSLDRIFNSAEFAQKGIGGLRWLKSGNSYTRIEASPTLKGGADLVKYDAETNKREVLIPAEKLVPAGASTALQIHGFDWSADDRQVLIYTNSARVWRQNTRGDYWVLDLASGKLTKLGGDAKPSTLMFAKFSPDGNRVAYVRENDLYVETPATGKTTRLTKDGSPTLSNGTSDWVNEEEFDLRDCWRWSPDSRSIAFWQFNAEGIKNFILLNNTSELYPTETKIPYPKVGTVNAAVRVGVINADGGQITWMKTPGDPRENYIAMMDWAGNSDEVVVQHLNRAQNNLQLMYCNAKTGEAKTIVNEKDEAWVDVEMDTMRWIDGGKRFLWVSDRDGWRHLYTVSRDGSDRKLITPGNFDIIALQGGDEAAGWVYYTASPDDATQRYLYRSKLDGSGKPERVTPEADKGWNAYNISPNGHWAIHTYSKFGTPSRIEFVNLTTKSEPRVIQDNADLKARLEKIDRGPSEFFKVDIGEGVTLDGWMIKPPAFDPAKKYPTLFFAYSEPASQTVTDNWGGGQYMWYLMLAQQGYIIASVDNRGTPAPKGRLWRKSIYRKIGRLNSQDQANAVKAITAKMPYVDASRIGIWGWSGGGSATLNAMFRYPDVYKVGMAVAPEADMRYYDTIYSERYMGLLPEAAEDYKQGAATTFAKNLKGDLLIVHGTGDDNVHYQATEVLFNALIAANKPFTMMAYPGRSHGIFEGEGTTRHLYELLTRYLKEKLPTNPGANVIP